MVLIILILSVTTIVATLVFYYLSYKENMRLRTILAYSGIRLVELERKVEFYKRECGELELELNNLKQNGDEKN